LTGAQRQGPGLSIPLFRAFVEGRPDEEHWELIDGVAMMMAPATLMHQRIASNLQRLLLESLDTHDPTLTAYQRSGVNIAPDVVNYDPEPDVVVVDALIAEMGKRYSDRFYLAAEIVSSSDKVSIQTKRDIYKLHATCKCVLTIRQERIEVRMDQRMATGWMQTVLQRAEDILALPDFGLRCSVAEIYKGTPLLPASSPRGKS
jgi:Uma2 family endonuclease